MAISFRNFNKRRSLWWTRVKTEYTLSYIGLRFSNREHVAFVQDNPLTVKIVRKYAVIISKVHDITYPIFRSLRRLRARIMSGPKTVKVASLDRTDYVDSNHLMLHTCFQILVDFVELELPLEATLHDSKFGHTKVGVRNPEAAVAFLKEYSNHSRYKEMLFLYTWWMDIGRYGYESTEKLVSEELAQQIYPGSARAVYQLESNFETFQERQETEMLDRLIKIRENMWT